MGKIIPATVRLAFFVVLLQHRGYADTPGTPPSPESPITVIDAFKDRVDVPVPKPPNVFDVGNAKQLFVDDWIVHHSEGLNRVFHAATKYDGNPLLTPTEPWEVPSVLLSGTVIYDPDRREDRFRMWYLCFTPEYTADFGDVKSKGGCVAYATSTDGLQWTRPTLRLHEFQGSTANNIVIPGPYGFPGVVYDPRDPDEARRYKAHARTSKGHTAYFSPDGVHWSDPVAMDLDGYDRSSVHWDPILKVWAASTKSWYRTSPDAVPWRGRGYQISSDFLHYEGKPSFLAGTEPGGNEIVYALEPFYYESQFLGIWARYRHEPDGFLDPQLVTSRNGRSWSRPAEKSLIPLTPLPNDYQRTKTAGSPDTGVNPLDPKVPWDYGNNNVNILGPLRVNDELWFYYSGRSSDHRSSPQTGAIGLAKLRLDGFASLLAEDHGVLVTRPIRMKQSQLHLNADAADGEIRVEILDESLEPIDRFRADQCNPIVTDGLRHTVFWNGSADLASLKGKTVHLRFVMSHASLYSFWFGQERDWCTPNTLTWNDAKAD